MVLEQTTLIPKLITILCQASDAILKIYNQSQTLKVETKPDNSPVTQADMASHKLLVEEIAKLTPDIPILSEEGIVPAEERKKWRKYWCIDPLDGTREFISHNGEFCINIGLIENHKPVMGLIYIPVQRACYYAAQGQGAFKELGESKPIPVHVKPWCSRKTIVAASRGLKPETAKQFFINLSEYEIVRAGSAKKFCWVAEGSADLYSRFGNTSEWDTAAGQCIVEEAGGCVVDLKGQPLRYNVRPSILNPHFLVAGDIKLLAHLKMGEEYEKKN